MSDFHSHSGDFGDLIYAIPAIRESGIGELVLYPRYDNATREIMDERRAQAIIPLLREACPCLSSVRWTQKEKPTPLNNFRNFMLALLRVGVRPRSVSPALVAG